MGLFDDDGDFFGKKKPYSATDKIGAHSGISDTMSSINEYKSGSLSHGLSVAEQIAAGGASDDVDALFASQAKNKKSWW